jgi:hypothetical protein
MDWSLSKLIRIESGAVNVSTTDLKALLQHYGITDQAKVDSFVEMAKASRDRRAWWGEYRESTSQQFVNYLAYENSASVIRQFEPLLIPGLLQDEDYAREVLGAYRASASDQSASDQRMKKWLELRMRRQQELFERPEPPAMQFVLDEAALHRWVGGRDVARRQLHRLKTEAMRENVTIQVVPFSAGAHPGIKGPFVILEFPDYDPDVLYQENVRGDMIQRDDQEEISTYHEWFEQLRTLARETDLETIIDKVLKQQLSP